MLFWLLLPISGPLWLMGWLIEKIDPVGSAELQEHWRRQRR